MILSTIERNVDGTIGYMSDFWTITAASEQAGYPASNLLTPDLNQKWVSWGQRASHNWIEAVSDIKNSYRQIALMGLFGLDRTNPSQALLGQFTLNTYRMIIDHYPIATRRRPSVATVSLTNLTGAASILNGPIDPPNVIPTSYVSTKMTATSNSSNTVLVADFQNYNATERPLSAVSQWLRVHYVDSVNPLTVPTIEVKLRYAGLVVGNALPLQFREPTSEGYIFNYSFNPGTAFSGLTGRVGVQVTGTTTGSSTPLPIGVEWVAELDGWGTDDESWDSLIDSTIDGVIRYGQIAELPKKLSVDPDAGIISYEILELETVYAYIELSDWAEYQITVSPGPIVTRTYTPLGGFEGAAFYTGRLVIAQGIDIDLDEVGGYARRKSSDISALRTYGGTLRGARNTLHWDEHDFNARIQSQSALAGDLDTFFENAGMRNPVVMIPDETEPGQAIYGILTRWEANDVGAHVEPGMETAGAEPYYDLSFSAIDARARRTLR